jgi:hypothetical protein
MGFHTFYKIVFECYPAERGARGSLGLALEVTGVRPLWDAQGIGGV